MNRILLLTLLVVWSSLKCSQASIHPSRRVLVRKKRFIAFPEGSSVSGALCLTVGVIGNPHSSYLSYALNWGVAYDLPNATWARQHAHGFASELQPTKAAAAAQRRSRRDLYERIELAMDDMGFNGRACVARALCESAKYLPLSRAERGSMIEEIVKRIFSLPPQRVLPHESAAVQSYDRIYRRSSREALDCELEYSECHFSLLELALGNYAVPPERRGAARAGAAAHRPSFM